MGDVRSAAPPRVPAVPFGSLHTRVSVGVSLRGGGEILLAIKNFFRSRAIFPVGEKGV